MNRLTATIYDRGARLGNPIAAPGNCSSTAVSATAYMDLPRL